MDRSLPSLTATIVSIIVILIIVFADSSSLLIEDKQNLNIVPGVSVHNITNRDVSLISESNFTWIRVDTWPSFGRSVTMAASGGLKVLGILEMEITDKAQLEAWNKTVRYYANTFRDNVSAWEVLNEPMVSFPYGTYRYFDPQLYFEMVKSAYNIIKKTNPSTPVIAFGGIRILDNAIMDYNWIQSLVSMGILSYCDAASIHIYATTHNSILTSMNYRYAISEIQNILGSEPLWVTETGTPYNKNPVEYINSVYPILQSMGISHIFWYEFRDWVPDYGQRFGLLQSDYTPRDAYYLFKLINKS